MKKRREKVGEKEGRKKGRKKNKREIKGIEEERNKIESDTKRR